MHRVVKPEILDDLPPDDPQAVGSRADLRLLNFIMGHAGFLSRAFHHPHASNPDPSRPLRLVELGAGDGTLLLRLARRWSGLGRNAHVTLIDRQSLISSETHRAFADVKCSVESVASDVFDWLKSPTPIADVILVNLFLHHFVEDELAELLQLVAPKTNLFLACEPRRSPFALAAARSLALLGCNAVTRHDAVVSVRAGFNGRELSALWPKPQTKEWNLSEKSFGLFSHCFFAQRNV